MQNFSALKAVLIGGSIAGALDLTYACVFSAWRADVAPSLVMQSVASGLLGPAAYEGGTPVAALGFCLHFLMMYLITTIFYLLSRSLPLLKRQPVGSGLFYGFIVFWVMNLIVLPLSATTSRISFDPQLLTANIAVHMAFIGLTVSLAVRRWA